MSSDEVNPVSHQLTQPYREPPVLRSVHLEGSVTRIIEQQTAKVPSHVFLTASLVAMAASAWFEIRDNPRASRFTGMWVAPLLVMGVYNKLVKTTGPT